MTFLQDGRVATLTRFFLPSHTILCTRVLLFRRHRLISQYLISDIRGLSRIRHLSYCLSFDIVGVSRIKFHQQKVDTGHSGIRGNIGPLTIRGGLTLPIILWKPLILTGSVSRRAVNFPDVVRGDQLNVGCVGWPIDTSSTTTGYNPILQIIRVLG